MTAQSVSGQPPIDLPSLYDRCMNDAAFLKEMLDLFIEQSTANLSKFRQALDAGNAEEARKLAHSLKGSASNLSADHLSQLFAQAEQLASEKSIDAVQKLLDALQAEFDRCVAYFPTLESQAKALG